MLICGPVNSLNFLQKNNLLRPFDHTLRHIGKSGGGYFCLNVLSTTANLWVLLKTSVELETALTYRFAEFAL